MSRPSFSSTKSNSTTSSRFSTSPTNSSTSQISLSRQQNQAISSQQRHQGLSAGTKLLAKQIRQSERNLASQDRLQFFNGGLQWLMEQTIEVESSGMPIRRRRGSLLTEKAVRMHNVVEGGRRSLGTENSNRNFDVDVEKTSSDAEVRIDAWVFQQTDEASDLPH